MVAISELIIKNDIPGIQAIAKVKGLEHLKFYKDLYKNTILHLAIKHENNDIFQYGIELNIDVNAKNVTGDSPLILACKRGLLEYAVKLISLGALG